jgi:hypothetical protein
LRGLTRTTSSVPCLEALREQGWELNRNEVDALTNTDVSLWSDVAERIDPRLQRCSLRGPKQTREPN